MDAQTLIKSSLRLVNAIGKGVDPGADDMADGLESLNDLIQSWSAKNILLPYRTIESFTMTAANSVTVGSGGDFNTSRPTNVLSGFIRVSDIDYPLLEMPEQEWREIAQKNVSVRPTRWYYEPNYSLGVLYFDSTAIAGETFYMTSLKPISTLATLTTAIDLPGEYLGPIKYELAIRLAPEYGVSVRPEIIQLAAETKITLESRNASNRVPVLAMDAGLSNNLPFNIYRGD